MTQQEFAARYSYDPKSDQLGSGGFGSVYKAYDNEEDCFVALKIAHVDMQHPELRLRNEVAKAERLKHKNVARYDACYTFTTFSGEMDIAVMRYYEHGSLDGFMRGGDLSMEERYDILTQILEGIAYLHSHGIIHRDLKPQNVLMVHHAGRYIPKITDFGISKQLEDGESSLVSNSVLGGTRSFASPEQLCERAIRKNTDLWSFGVIAYYMLVGELPFTTGTFSQSSDEGRSEQLRQILSGRLPEKINGVSEPWLSVIRGCLVVDGTQRLQHAEDCLRIIRNYIHTIPVGISIEEDTIMCDDVKEKTLHVDESDNVDMDTSGDSEVNSNNGRKVINVIGCLSVIIIAFIAMMALAVFFTPSNGSDSMKVVKEAIITEEKKTTGPYSIGDYYNENGKKGVVFEVWDGGSHGKIVSLHETKSRWCTRNQYDKKILLGASSTSDGKENTDAVMGRSDKYQYPAFTYCREEGDDWYLPAMDELEAIYNNKSEINLTLKQYGKEIEASSYWSSTEESVDDAWDFRIREDGSKFIFANLKHNNFCVRAVSTF